MSQINNLLKTVAVPKGVERIKADRPDCTAYISIYDVSNRMLYVQPEDSVSFTTRKLDTSLDSKDDQQVFHGQETHQVP